MTPFTTITTGHTLASPAAASYARMCAAAGRVLGVTSALRTRVEQARLYAGWLRREPGYAFALPPGLSVHERGYAADFRPTTYTWLELHAAAHGWRRTNPDERWHYEYTPANDRHRNDPAPPRATEPAAAPTPPEDDIMGVTRDELRADMAALLAPIRAALLDDMVVYRIPGTNACWLDLGTARRHLSEAAYHALGSPMIVDLPLGDVFWAMPCVRDYPGELYHAEGDPAAYVLEGYARRWITEAGYAAMRPCPPIVPLPADHPIWALPALGVTP